MHFERRSPSSQKSTLNVRFGPLYLPIAHAIRLMMYDNTEITQVADEIALFLTIIADSFLVVRAKSLL